MSSLPLLICVLANMQVICRFIFALRTLPIVCVCPVWVMSYRSLPHASMPWSRIQHKLYLMNWNISQKHRKYWTFLENKRSTLEPHHGWLGPSSVVPPPMFLLGLPHCRKENPLRDFCFVRSAALSHGLSLDQGSGPSGSCPGFHSNFLHDPQQLPSSGHCRPLIIVRQSPSYSLCACHWTSSVPCIHEIHSLNSLGPYVICSFC